jgi:hypothetical protein
MTKAYYDLSRKYMSITESIHNFAALESIVDEFSSKRVS